MSYGNFRKLFKAAKKYEIKRISSSIKANIKRELRYGDSKTSVTFRDNLNVSSKIITALIKKGYKVDLEVTAREKECKLKISWKHQYE